jgi:hypothetical protein
VGLVNGCPTGSKSPSSSSSSRLAGGLVSVWASEILAGRPTRRDIVRSRWYSIAHALLLISTSRLSDRLRTVPSLYNPSWNAVVSGVDPSAGRRVSSLVLALYTLTRAAHMYREASSPANKTSRLSRWSAFAYSSPDLADP